MSANYYLPAKASAVAQYTVSTPGTYSWTAPNANNNGLSYKILLQMWGAGSGGAGGSNHYYGANGGGGGGAYVYSEVTVVPGTVYTFIVGAGGIGYAGNPEGSLPSAGGAGTAGGFSRISDGSGAIITAGGGQTASGYPSAYNNYPTGGAGGTVTVGQPAKVVSYNGVNGGAGGNGGGTNGASVLPQLSQPGGTGGSVSTGPGGSQYYHGGGGASVRANGGNAGYVYNSYGSHPGAGGGAGYEAGTNGGNSSTGGSGGNLSEYKGPGGNGGKGRLSFEFITSNGGSAGSAPV